MMIKRGNLIDFFVVALCALIAISRADPDPTQMTTALLIRVDQSGKGDYRKIQDAINAVPSNNSELVYIWVKPGIYIEKIVVPADKPFITLSGTNVSQTIITWKESGEIYVSPTFTVLASDFVARFLTIQVYIMYIYVHAFVVFRTLRLSCLVHLIIYIYIYIYTYT
jgi:pectinesterase